MLIKFLYTVNLDYYFLVLNHTAHFLIALKLKLYENWLIEKIKNKLLFCDLTRKWNVTKFLATPKVNDYGFSILNLLYSRNFCLR